jgi:hypothetical protein
VDCWEDPTAVLCCIEARDVVFPGTGEEKGLQATTVPYGNVEAAQEYIMADQYVLKANVGRLELDLIDMPCQTEREALAKAGKIFDQFEGNARIEILLNDMRPALWGVTRLEEWNREGRPLPPTDAC